jgi:hypothetical protein
MGLGFSLKRQPSGWDEGADYHLNIDDLESDQWTALFFDVLGCPEAEPFVQGEDINEYHKRFGWEFQQAITDYPMLGRIWDFYADVWYEPEEIEQLRRECLKVHASTSNTTALEGLRLLLRGCDEASKAKLGLFLVAD